MNEIEVVEEPPVASSSRTARISPLRRWLLCGLCFALLVALLFLYALLPLEEWLSLIIGTIILPVFIGFILLLALALGALAEWKPEEES